MDCFFMGALSIRTKRDAACLLVSELIVRKFARDTKNLTVFPDVGSSGSNFEGVIWLIMKGLWMAERLMVGNVLRLFCAFRL
jgi:hypothetical protein